MKNTLEQHRDFGEKIKEFRETLMQSHVFCNESRRSRASRAASNVLKHIERLKNELDSLVFRDYPEGKDVTKIYYGMSEAWKVRQTKPKVDNYPTVLTL